MLQEIKTNSVYEPRIVENLKPNEKKQCTYCGKTLKGCIAWLELDQRSNTYHDSGCVPKELSQGWFPFGITCARKLLKTSYGINKGT